MKEQMDSIDLLLESQAGFSYTYPPSSPFFPYVTASWGSAHMWHQECISFVSFSGMSPSLCTNFLRLPTVFLLTVLLGFLMFAKTLTHHLEM